MTQLYTPHTPVSATRTVHLLTYPDYSETSFRLDVTLQLTKGIPYTENIEVNVYDSNHNFISINGFRWQRRTKMRKLVFECWCDEVKNNGTFLLVFTRDYKPFCFSYIHFDGDYDQVVTSTLQEVTDLSILGISDNTTANDEEALDAAKQLGKLIADFDEQHSDDDSKAAKLERLQQIKKQILGDDASDDATGYDGNEDDEDYDDMFEDDYDNMFEDDYDEPLESPTAPCGSHPKKISPRERLERMIGLDNVKRELDQALTMVRFWQRRQQLGLGSTTDHCHHMLFLGNPGTGKTTVARLIGEIYHDLGLLSKGHTLETNRTQLVGEYIGETEQKMKDVIDKARGGVLFIDEAYTLDVTTKGGSDFGKQVINALLPVLSDPDPDMIVILAGYDDKMTRLLQTNPGLPDRFPVRLHFDDYDADQLCQIAEGMLAERRFDLTPQARLLLTDTARKATATRDAYFGNGRWVRNFVEHGIITSMARRCMTLSDDEATIEALSTVEESDVAEAAAAMNVNVKVAPRAVGFLKS